MDAVLCSVQTDTQESQAGRSRSLRVRLGVVARTAIAIGTTYLRSSQNKVENLIPPAQRGRIIPFPVLDSDSVPTLFRLAWPPVFDFGTSNRHKFIFDFMGWAALKPSKALEQAVSDRKA